MLSRRVAELQESATMAMADRAARLRAAGADVVSFSAGEPDFDTPEHIKQAAALALKQGKTKYTPATGIPELKQAFADKLRRDNGLSYEPSQVLVSSGAKHSIYNILQSLLQEGDEAVIPSPYWVSYPTMVQCTGASPVLLPTEESDGFKLRPERLSRVVNPRTKLLILCSPCNPTGAVYRAEELAALAEVVLASKMMVLSDEIYEKLCFGVPFATIAAARPEIKDRVVVINGPSKAYAMTGWRIGCAAGPQELITAAGRLQSQSTSNPASISQYAALAAFNGEQGCVEKMRSEYQARRDVIVSRLRRIPGVTCAEPEGAFYAFPNVSALYGRKRRGEPIAGSAALAEALLEDAHVAVVPGAAFGSNAHIRLSFATSLKSIEEGLDRIERFVKNLA